MTHNPPPPVFNSLDSIGNTPVVRLGKIVPSDHAEVYLKLESFNPTGSYKDRMALSMIERAEARGQLKNGMKVIEATGGSTGSSLAYVCAVKGYKFVAVSSNAFAKVKIDNMKAFGGHVEIIHSPSGAVTADLFPTMISKAQELVKEGNQGYFIGQMDNKDALIGYRKIGYEILQQFPEGIDAFCGAVGTAGMIVGVSSVLKSDRPSTKVVVLEPTSSPAITEGHGGTHSVEGIGIGRVPPHLVKDSYDEARAIPEEKAREMCRRLAREEGILVGVSSGLNVVAAIELAKELGPGKKIVTMGCDSGLKYLDGDLFVE